MTRDGAELLRKSFELKLDLARPTSAGAERPAPSLTQSSIDLKALPRDARALVGGQEQRQARDVVGRYRIRNGLAGAQFGDLPLVRVPEPALAFGDHHAGRDRVDANAIGTDQTGERVGEADDRRLPAA